MAKDKKDRTPNPWIAHVKSVRTANKDLSYKEALKRAKETYTRIKREPRIPGVRKVNKWMVHIADWKKSNPNWKEKYSYKEVLKLCKETYTSKTTYVSALNEKTVEKATSN